MIYLPRKQTNDVQCLLTRSRRKKKKPANERIRDGIFFITTIVFTLYNCFKLMDHVQVVLSIKKKFQVYRDA